MLLAMRETGLRYVLVGTVLLAMATFAGAAHAAPPKGSDVKAELLADVATITPGKPFTLAIVLNTQRNWHIYWQNPGDAGTPTEFTFHLPDGYTVSPVQFPLPIKFEQPGDIVAYGYTGKVIFLATVTPPAENVLKPGNVKLDVDVSWLVCNDVCVPGGTTLSLELPAATNSAGAAENQDLFDKARALMPASEAPKDVVDQVRVLNTGAGETGIEITWKKQPKGSVEYFPLTPDGLVLSDVRIQNSGNKTRYQLRWRHMAGNNKPPEALRILVAYRDDAGARHGFFTTIDLAKSAIQK
jgi:DsbC/DsbD-like thiol-disulfide interchange protein